MSTIQNPVLAKQQQKLDEAGPFFRSMIDELGINAENNTITLADQDREAGGQTFTQQIFEEDKDGNVIINYWDAAGNTVNCWQENKSRNSYTDKYKYFRRVRLKDPKDTGKYRGMKGEGSLPFIPVQVVEKFRAGDQIKTLIITEGEKKAWYAAQHGLAVIGVSGIFNFKDENGELFLDIRRIIERCRVENVVILFDADCRDISRKALTEGEDLVTRPLQFYTAIKRARQLIIDAKYEKTRSAPAIYFLHPNKGTKLNSDPKGLDDFLIKAIETDRLDAVLAELVQLEISGHYFSKFSISTSCRHLYNYFRLDRQDVESFYNLHAASIGGTPFIFNKDKYAYIEAVEKVKLVSPEWAASVMRVGDDFFVEAQEPTIHDTLPNHILRSRSTNFLKDYFRPDFSKYIKKYMGFCNMPDHLNYQRIVEAGGHEYYNRYQPFVHPFEEGEFKTTLKFIKHIFGEILVKHPVTGEEIPRYVLGLDYIQHLLMNPTQILPVLILYSPENSTGKSTFFKLMARIFRGNTVFVSNRDMQNDFNSVFADKLLIICEETMLERQKHTESIKAMATAEKITINEKNVSQYSIEFYGKFMFASNKERMIYVSAEDERFWILQVPVATEKNPDLLAEMEKEIPAFVHYLRNRKLVTKRESRMHFHPGLILTDTFRKTVAVNEPGEVSNIREKIAELFEIADDDVNELRLPMKNIRAEVWGKRGGPSWKFMQELLGKYLGVDQERAEDGTVAVERGSYRVAEYQYDGLGNKVEANYEVNWRGRPYVFKRADFEPIDV